MAGENTPHPNSGNVRSYTGRTVAAISVSGYAPRLTQRRIRELAPVVMGTAFRISEKLGFHPGVGSLPADMAARRPLAEIGRGAGVAAGPMPKRTR